MRDIHQITSTELLVLKQQYDKDFLRYWRKPDGSSKFKPISMDAFKSRFFKPPQEGISNVQNKKIRNLVLRYLWSVMPTN